MAKPYSIDLRERVVASVEEEGLSRHRAAARFGIGVSTAIAWVRRFRETGSVAPGQMGGHKPRAIRDAHRDWLVQRCKEKDFTLRGLVAELAERDLKVDYRSVWQFVHDETLSFKKTVHASEQDRPDVAHRRGQWKKYQGRIDPSRLVFIDETWTKTNMTPLRGWAPRGRRLRAKVPRRRWKTTTFLAALRHDRIDAPWLLDGAINGECFRAYVEKVLLPTLTPGDIVIMDNLGSHKSKAVRRAIRGCGAKLFFLPKYSPDLNPIEMVFAKAQASPAQGRRPRSRHRLRRNWPAPRRLHPTGVRQLPHRSTLRTNLKSSCSSVTVIKAGIDLVRHMCYRIPRLGNPGLKRTIPSQRLFLSGEPLDE